MSSRSTASGPGGVETLSFLHSGTQTEVWVDGANGTAGPFTLQVHQTYPASNEHCESAIPASSPSPSVPHYSTWRGQPTLYLEDLFVRPAALGRGIGKALMQHLARVAVERGCGRFVWQVLDWNAPGIAFYESLGANVHREWLTCRIEGPALVVLAGAGVAGRVP